MSQTISPATNKPYGLKRTCQLFGIARSTIYRKKTLKRPLLKRGPKPKVPDEALLGKIREDIKTSPFKGEGHRKVHARLKRQSITVGRNRVLEMMRKNQLLSPHRREYRPPNPHDGKITTEAPDVMWGSDGTKVRTVDDGWIWIFSVADHWNTECLGWNVCKTGDRFAAFEPISQAVKTIYGSLSKGIAKGLKLRIDNGTQYTSDYFLKQLAYLGIEDSFGLVRQPQTNGVAERFHRTLKEQVINGKVFKNVDEVKEVIKEFAVLYNEQWLVAKRGYQSPREARRNYLHVEDVA